MRCAADRTRRKQSEETLMARDSEIDRFREQLAGNRQNQAAEVSIADRRKTFDAQHGAVPMPPGCVAAPIQAGQVAGELITPKGALKNKALLYHHGGGYMFGSSTSHRHLVSRLAEAAGVVAFNMDYRLAPEHPYPAALEDALRDYKYVLDRGFDASDIVVGGESAGGNLTAALLLAIKRDGLPMPSGGYLLSAWLDMTQSGESYGTRPDPMLSLVAMTTTAAAFVGTADPKDPLVSPVRADLAGLPPLLIQVGSDEVLLSDSLEIARRAALAGVGVELSVWPEMVHAFPLFHHVLPTCGGAAINAAGEWMRRQLNLPKSPAVESAAAAGRAPATS
jgi:acetyl esterase/lipase